MRKIIFAFVMAFCLVFTFSFVSPQVHASSKTLQSHTSHRVKVQPDVYRDSGCNWTDVAVITTSGTLCFAGVGWSSVRIYGVTRVINDGFFLQIFTLLVTLTRCGYHR